MKYVSDIEKFRHLVEKYKGTPDLMVDELTSINARTQFGDQLIHIASVSGNASDIVDLLSLGADVNSVGENGYTPLHYAAEQGHLNVVKVLLENGADAELTNKNVETALELAEILGNDLVAEFMKKEQ